MLSCFLIGSLQILTGNVHKPLDNFSSGFLHHMFSLYIVLWKWFVQWHFIISKYYYYSQWHSSTNKLILAVVLSWRMVYMDVENIIQGFIKLDERSKVYRRGGFGYCDIQTNSFIITSMHTQTVTLMPIWTLKVITGYNIIRNVTF